MKVKVSRQEIRECVENAVLRIVKEGKALHKMRDNDFAGKKAPKHGKLDKFGGDRKPKGNKGNQDWTQYGED